MKLKPSAVPAPAVRTLNGERLTTYYYHTLPLRMLGAGGKQLKMADYFLAADIEGFDMVLGIPWLRNIDPDIQWTEGTWAQHKWAAWKPRRRPRLVSAQAFHEIVKNEGLQAMAIHLEKAEENEWT
jgi:hypothetical protein